MIGDATDIANRKLLDAVRAWQDAQWSAKYGFTFTDYLHTLEMVAVCAIHKDKDGEDYVKRVTMMRERINAG